MNRDRQSFRVGVILDLRQHKTEVILKARILDRGVGRRDEVVSLRLPPSRDTTDRFQQKDRCTSRIFADARGTAKRVP